jgi:hypothetical protein
MLNLKNTAMKTIELSKLRALVLVLTIVFSGMAFKPVEKVPLCQPIFLISPPSNFYVHGGGCSSTSFCNRSSTTLLTMSGATGCSHTWTFTNTTTGCVKVFNTASGVSTLQVSIPGSTGDNISLVITDPGGGSSATYYFTAVGC